MKPRPYVEIQAVISMLVAALVLGVLGREADLPAAVTLTVGLSIWIFFLGRYRLLLRKAPNPRSDQRRGKDKIMVGCFVLGLVLPTTLAWVDFVALRLDPFGAILSPGEAAIASAGVLTIPLSILVSSSVDWHLIRPFREGVLNEPTCRPEIHESGRGLDYAKYWVLHRMVSEFLAFGAVVVLAGLFFAIISTAVHSEEGKSAASFVGGLAIAIWSASKLSGLEAALGFVRYSYANCELGSWVRGRTDTCVDIEGFVLDVSISPGLQLIKTPRGDPAKDIADKRKSVPLKQVENVDSATPPAPLCSTRCEFWNPACEVGLREKEAARIGEGEAEGLVVSGADGAAG
jgi:hypothetical protein